RTQHAHKTALCLKIWTAERGSARESSVKGVSAVEVETVVPGGEIVPGVEGVGSIRRAVTKFWRPFVNVTVVVVMTVLHCHRRSREHNRKCGCSNQSVVHNENSPFTGRTEGDSNRYQRFLA